jgi:hypothetical protein
MSIRGFKQVLAVDGTAIVDPKPKCRSVWLSVRSDRTEREVCNVFDVDAAQRLGELLIAGAEYVRRHTKALKK